MLYFFGLFQRILYCKSFHPFRQTRTLWYQRITLNWFKSYLSDRCQSLEICGIQSETRNINCGAQQGGVLGPLLFLLYINDTHLSSTLVDFHFFADDMSLVFKNKNLKHLKTVVYRELLNVSNWLLAKN